MSDGMSDANAVGSIATELREAAYVLRDAIERAEAGHRGLTVDIIETVNEVLRCVGGPAANYELRRIR